MLQITEIGSKLFVEINPVKYNYIKVNMLVSGETGFVGICIHPYKLDLSSIFLGHFDVNILIAESRLLSVRPC